MTAFVILAAGPGSRMGRAGDSLHKALVPLDGKAVISHQIGLAPPDARIIVCTGHRAAQVRSYLELAHPGLKVTYVVVKGWDQPGGGPGASLLAAREVAGDDDLIFTSCDTLWEPDPELWPSNVSWAGVAPVPAGTPPERWCRISSRLVSRVATGIYDKTPGVGGDAYTGLAMIKQGHLHAFWKGIAAGGMLGDERQVTGGLGALIPGLLTTRRLTWTDIGDEAAYARAVAARSGYNWAKPGEVTYLLPDQGRVVKYHEDARSIAHSVHRQFLIAGAVPPLTGIRPNMISYEYVPGMTGYEVADSAVTSLVPRLLDSAKTNLWRPVAAGPTQRACDQFYRVKTGNRVAMLRAGLREMAEHATGRVDWAELAVGCEPVTFHGDFNLGNVIVRPDGGFTWIDWREDFAGETGWGDRRYDLGKLAAGMIVHWGNARRGDFRPWPAGGAHLAQIGEWLGGKIPHDVMVIAALSLINCAPLHAAPLDEVLVARGAGMLEELS